MDDPLGDLKSVGCESGIHDWEMWKIHTDAKITRGQNEDYQGQYLVQQRACKKCGLIQRKHSKTQLEDAKYEEPREKPRRSFMDFLTTKIW